jgi:energy-coupling factor transporter ATP-binding protein EcfA2
LQDIIDFSGISAFIDTPVKYYSSGMYARLGFSVAAYTDPDILLVDEVLAVGDYSFQQQCYRRMQELKRGGTTIVLVSHNLSAISETCDEVVVLNHGEKVFQGPTGLGLAEYASAIRGNVIEKESLEAGVDGIGRRLMTREARIRDVHITNSSGKPVQVVKPGEHIIVQAMIDSDVEAVDPHFSCFVRDELGRLIYDQTTLWQNYHTPMIHKGQSARVIFDLQLNLVEGIYQIGIDMHYSDLSCYYDRIESAAPVVVRGGDGAKGIADLRCQFKVETLQNHNSATWKDE